MEKKHNIGLVIGRFQPMHKGHEKIIRTALDTCSYVIVVVGSTNKRHTLENPLNGGLRMWHVRHCFMEEYRMGRLVVVGIPDRVEVRNDSSWGEYVMEKIAEVTNLVPSIVFEGQESVRKDWYSSIGLEVVHVDRNELKISGTEMRYAVLRGDKEFYLANCATGMEEYYDELKEELENAAKNASSN